MNRTRGAQGDDLLRPVLDGAADYFVWLGIRVAAVVALVAVMALIVGI